jgi:hypothetical protein
MRGFKLGKELARLPASSLLCVLGSLPDPSFRVGTSRHVKQALVGFRVLNHRRRLAIHRKHHGALAFLQC